MEVPEDHKSMIKKVMFIIKKRWDEIILPILIKPKDAEGGDGELQAQLTAVRGQQGNFTPMLLKMCDEVIFKFKDSLFNNQDDLFKKVSLKRFELLQVGL